jgi:hypothetical protein
MILATAKKRSAEANDEPPNFNTRIFSSFYNLSFKLKKKAREVQSRAFIKLIFTYSASDNHPGQGGNGNNNFGTTV